MSCIYSNFQGDCTLWNEDDDLGTTYKDCDMGWDEIGSCCCEEDPDPSYTCVSFESIEGEEW
jgi:hypothetical protein